MTIRANCKINLGLSVVRKREDGYHELQTVMLPVAGLYDVVEVERGDGNEIEFSQCGIVVDCPPERNLMVRAARLMQQRYGVGGVRLSLDKRVPFGAGLGGGSSDATAVIVAINEIYALNLDKPTLAALAAELGSDTPFFVYNTPQYCTGRGEVMRPIELELSGMWLAVVKPDEGVSTAEAYSGVRPSQPAEELPSLLRRDIGEWQRVIINDFERHIFELHPAIAELKERLLEGGARYASMSGSGSALFGIYDHRPELQLPEGTFLHIEQL
ncbi:MAG: 4-(cytidine 5'-diphospho)-2-C-methyl-D-erythritol kinase [Alistipes sp.]|nr:4-(cytidine 5'-diphospho)-2-C-methyl-D-erythritol kinase [Alistipes sp.]